MEDSSEENIPSLLELVKKWDTESISNLLNNYICSDNKGNFLDCRFYDELAEVYWENDKLYNQVLEYLTGTLKLRISVFPGNDSEDTR